LRSAVGNGVKLESGRAGATWAFCRRFGLASGGSARLAAPNADAPSVGPAAFSAATRGFGAQSAAAATITPKSARAQRAVGLAAGRAGGRSAAPAKGGRWAERKAGGLKSRFAERYRCILSVS